MTIGTKVKRLPIHKLVKSAMLSPLLRGHLPSAATFFGSLEPKYSENEPTLSGHLSRAANFRGPWGDSLRQG